jgi:glyoxylase-like metal-dependent hydrolase (beta-lactamase superfamily II)
MKITDEVYALESTRGNYAYAILGSPPMLVDTGRPGQGRKILQELSSLNIPAKSVRHILLTHHDVDHIGSAAYLQQATSAQVWASQTDLPFILGQKPRPGIKRIASLLMPAEIPVNVSAFPPENKLEGIRIIPTPGHTPGHVCLLYKDVLFAGDLVVSFKGKLSLSPGIMTLDMSQVKESAHQVAALPFYWICPAHGAPIERGQLWDQMLAAQ